MSTFAAFRMLPTLPAANARSLLGIVLEPPRPDLIVRREHDIIMLFGVSDELIEHGRARWPSDDEIVHRQRHQHGMFAATLIKRVELRLKRTQHEFRRVR